MTEDGEAATWKGFGIGKPTGPGYSAGFAVAGSVQTASAKLAHLHGMASLAEYHTDEAGNDHWTAWEWRAPAG